MSDEKHFLFGHGSKSFFCFAAQEMPTTSSVCPLETFMEMWETSASCRVYCNGTPSAEHCIVSPSSPQSL